MRTFIYENCILKFIGMPLYGSSSCLYFEYKHDGFEFYDPEILRNLVNEHALNIFKMIEQSSRDDAFKKDYYTALKNLDDNVDFLKDFPIFSQINYGTNAYLKFTKVFLVLPADDFLKKIEEKIVDTRIEFTIKANNIIEYLKTA